MPIEALVDGERERPCRREVSEGEICVSREVEKQGVPVAPLGGTLDQRSRIVHRRGEDPPGSRPEPRRPLGSEPQLEKALLPAP